MTISDITVLIRVIVTKLIFAAAPEFKGYPYAPGQNSRSGIEISI